jgi:ATP-dependent RNA helicase SUPV3L1/SUV3
MRAHLRELAVRSSSAREAIREAVRAPSVEVGLRHFDDFLSLHDLDGASLARLAAGDDLERVRFSLELFRAWYLTTRAPKLTAMNAPWEWYPKARMMRRHFVFHSGPTNSGKTHAALERLVAAPSGVYCAPLKALASQVWLRLSERVSCDLLIGDERQFAGSAEHVSCTCEMTPIELAVDVAVIDEIQLIEDRDRGWAWTRALLGLPAREIHLCGEPRALAVIKRLLWHTKEAARLTVVEHKRLVPLNVAPDLGGRIAAAENGDCFVCFSRRAVFDTAKQLRQLERGGNISGGGGDAKTVVHVHTVYGAMPFAVRQRETEAFNAGAETTSDARHVLVTTDAVQYGLNLSIRRMIFTTLRKFDGKQTRQLAPSAVLQIAGRAGRFGRRFGSGGGGGFATTLHPGDHAVLADTLRAGAAALPPIERAGLLPPADLLAVFAETKIGSSSFADIVRTFAEACTVGDTFFACDMTRSLVAIAKLLDDVAMPSVAEKIMFCFAPVSGDGGGGGDATTFLRRLAVEHGRGGPVRLQLDAECEELQRRWSVNANDNGNGNDELPPPSLLDASPRDFAAALDAFYVTHNPAKRGDVASIVAKFPRDQLVASLAKKYGSAPRIPQPGRGETLAAVQRDLQRCETLYRLLEVYGWLAWRFPRTFCDLSAAAQAKVALVGTIDTLLRRQVQLEQ